MSILFKHHPGSNYQYAICDVCGFKLRAKDLHLVRDPYSPLNGRLVCAKDLDKPNPQSYPLKMRKESQVNPKFVRVEQTPREVFISTADEIDNPVAGSVPGRLAGSPKMLTVTGATSSSVDLNWFGPDFPGSENNTGYKIERESPVGGGFSTVEITTIPAMMYTDTTVSSGTQYNYRVSSVSSVGTGSVSNSASVTTS